MDDGEPKAAIRSLSDISMRAPEFLPVEGIAFFDEVAACAQFRIGKTNFRSRIVGGLFPPPVKFGARSLWPRHELDAVAGAVIGGASDDDLRALVAQLVEARKANTTWAAA